jgi:hypothetical protein
MCPACMATTVFLIASAISSGGVAAVLVNRLRAPRGEKSVQEGSKQIKQKEEVWVK